MPDKDSNIMDKIAESNKSVVTGIDEKDIEHWIIISVLGRKYKVPAGLTIMQAMEFAGYRFVRSCGCRAGFCGACATIYNFKNDPQLRYALACQKTVEQDMYLVQHEQSRHLKLRLNRLRFALSFYISPYAPAVVEVELIRIRPIWPAAVVVSH